MPTDLPGSRRKRPPQTQAAEAPKNSLLAKTMNAFMVGSAVLLFALVLLQEKRYTDGEAGSVADAFIQKAQAAIADTSNASDTFAPN